MTFFHKTLNWLNAAWNNPTLCPFTRLAQQIQPAYSGCSCIPQLATSTRGSSSSFPEQKGHLLNSSDIRVDFFNSIQDISNDWETATDDHNLFLQRPFLTAVEEQPPGDVQFAYLIFYKNNRPIGIAYCQILRFNVNDNIKDDGKEKVEKPVIRRLASQFKNFVVKQIDFSVLSCGNILLTGEYGYYFDEAVVDKNQQLIVLEEGLEYASQQLKKQGAPVDGLMIKDLTVATQPQSKKLLVEKHKFTEFSFQPSMIIDLRPEWLTFEDYLEAMSSKYRVRAKRAAKKGFAIREQELSLAEITTVLPKIQELFREVADNAGFSMVELEAAYFLNLKKHLGDKFHLIACYIEDEMVAFYTMIENHDELEAHFLGFNQIMNREHHIYINMLYNMVKTGIEKRKSKVVFARTALEIKSSIGAEPHEMYLYIRYRHQLPNLFLGKIVNYFEPKGDWVQRHPFK